MGKKSSSNKEEENCMKKIYLRPEMNVVTIPHIQLLLPASKAPDIIQNEDDTTDDFDDLT